mgnify:CR=1 FL=1
MKKKFFEKRRPFWDVTLQITINYYTLNYYLSEVVSALGSAYDVCAPTDILNYYYYYYIVSYCFLLVNVNAPTDI